VRAVLKEGGGRSIKGGDPSEPEKENLLSHAVKHTTPLPSARESAQAEKTKKIGVSREGSSYASRKNKEERPLNGKLSTKQKKKEKP